MADYKFYKMPNMLDKILKRLFVKAKGIHVILEEQQHSAVIANAFAVATFIILYRMSCFEYQKCFEIISNIGRKH